jgi:hypothetical protein
MRDEATRLFGNGDLPEQEAEFIFAMQGRDIPLEEKVKLLDGYRKADSGKREQMHSEVLARKYAV